MTDTLLKYLVKVVVGTYAASCTIIATSQLITNMSTVKKGYVDPSQIEIKTLDIDKDDTLETILLYNNKKYLFKTDDSKKPVLLEYKIKPAKIQTE
jgi:hypothetical protein